MRRVTIFTLLLLDATLTLANPVRLTGGIDGASAGRLGIRLTEMASRCCSDCSGPAREVRAEILSGNAGWEGSSESSRPLRMEVTLPGGRAALGTLAPPLHDSRVAPLRLPASAEYRVLVVGQSGKPVAGHQVRSPGERLPYGYALTAAECTTDDEGTCSLPLTGSELEALLSQAPMGGRLLPSGVVELRGDRQRADSSEAGEARRSEAGTADDSAPLALRVVDEAGVPITGAVAWIPSDPSCYGVSGPEGSIELDLPGDLSAAELMVGFSGREIQRIHPLPRNRRSFTVTLGPGDAAVAARVVGPRRENLPLHDVEVSWNQGGRTMFTDEEGRFVLRGLREATRVAADLRKPGFSEVRKSEVATEISTALSRDLLWRMDRNSTVSGTIAVPDGDEPADFFASLAGAPETTATPDAAGRFTLDRVPAGGGAVEVWQHDDVVVLAEFSAPREGANIDLGVLTPGATASLWGWVTDQHGDPVEDASILLDLAPGDKLQRPVSPDGSTFASRPIARTGSSGEFVIRGLEIGAELAVAAWKEGYAADQRRVVVDASEVIQELEMVALDPVTLRLTSSYDGSPVVDAAVFIDIGLPPALNRDRSAHDIVAFSDPSGRLEIFGYPEGKGKIEIVADGFVTLSRSLTFPERAGEEVVIPLDPTATLTGTVLDSEGLPLAGANIDRQGVFGPFIPNTTSAPDGTFTLEGMPIGRSILSIRGPLPGDSWRREVEVFPGGAHVELILVEQPSSED